MLKKGFQRVKVDGEFYEINNVPDLKKNFKHNIDVVIDRLIIGKDIKSRLADSFEIALSLSDGLAVIEMSRIAGLALSERREPGLASTYGVGQLMSAAVSHGARGERHQTQKHSDRERGCPLPPATLPRSLHTTACFPANVPVFDVVHRFPGARMG